MRRIAAGLIMLIVLTALSLHPGRASAQPGPLGAACSLPGSCPLGTTWPLSDASTVTVWDAYATGDPAPDPGAYMLAVSATICTSDHPRLANQMPTTSHFDVATGMFSGHPKFGFYGWDEGAVIGPGTCYGGWLAYELPLGRPPGSIRYFELPCAPNPVSSALFALQDCRSLPSGFWDVPY